MDCNYMDIQSHIYRARVMRSQAMGEIMATGWHRIKAALSRLTGRIQDNLPSRLRALHQD